jgi:hypothetical protein
MPRRAFMDFVWRKEYFKYILLVTFFQTNIQLDIGRTIPLVGR